MAAYETNATVEEDGRVRVDGVPFEAGTVVAVMIVPTVNGTADAGRAARLLAALDCGRNSESVGPLNRAELYDSDRIH